MKNDAVLTPIGRSLSNLARGNISASHCDSPPSHARTIIIEIKNANPCHPNESEGLGLLAEIPRQRRLGNDT